MRVELAVAEAVVRAAEKAETAAASVEVPMDHGSEEEDEADDGEVSDGAEGEGQGV